MLRIRVSTASAEITETELITTGRRGLECAFEFNSAWDGLAKTVIVNGVVKRDIVLVSDTITVPGECLAREQFPLRIGVYGANGAGEIVIPTIWANFGKILPSARPSGIDPDEVTPDVVAQIQTNSSDALRLAQEVMRRADSGEFDGRDGATGPAGRDGRPGKNGNSIWTTTETPAPATGGVAFTQLTGRSAVPPIVGDIIIRSSRYVYDVVEVTPGGVVIGHLIGDIKGEQGVADTIWRTTASIGSVYPFGYVVNVSDLVGRSGATPKAGDLVIGPESGQTGDPTYLYTISGVGSSVAGLDGIGSIKGATGATGPQGPGVTEDLRAALLQLAQKVAYVDEHGADYYQDLYNALYLPSDIVFITAVFNQGTTKVMDTDSLDSLKPMLTVFGRYDDNTSVVLTNYTLTGVLTPGTSTVTVSALGKTTTFDVLVTGLTSISAVYTQSGTVYDTYTLDSLKADLVVTAVYSDSSTQTVAAADYTLSGTLTTGTSAITVSYGGKTTTFNVTVTSRIPSAYKQVEYIESHGNQAIMTDIIPRNTRTIVTFEFTQFVGSTAGSRMDNFVTGVYNANNMRYLACAVDQYNQFCFKGRDNSYQWKGPKSPTGKHTVDFNNASHQAKYDGVVQATSNLFPITSGDNKLAIFARGHSSAASYNTTYGYARIYSLRYEDNDTGNAVGEFIPCYRKADGVIGMYDLVSNTFYENVNSGEPFTKGADAWETGV